MTEGDSAQAVIEKYRTACLFYLKIDFGIFAALGAMATIFRGEQVEVFQGTLQIKSFIVGAVILLCAGLFFESALLSAWVKAHNSAKVPRWAPIGTHAQLWLHVMLIAALAGYALGFAEGFVGNYEEVRALRGVQLELEIFARAEGHYPKTLNELTAKQPSAYEFIQKLDIPKIHYELHESLGYVLRYRDRTFDHRQISEH